MTDYEKAMALKELVNDLATRYADGLISYREFIDKCLIKFADAAGIVR